MGMGQASAWGLARQRPLEYRWKMDTATHCSGACSHTWPCSHGEWWSAGRGWKMAERRIRERWGWRRETLIWRRAGQQSRREKTDPTQRKNTTLLNRKKTTSQKCSSGERNDNLVKLDQNHPPWRKLILCALQWHCSFKKITRQTAETKQEE